MIATLRASRSRLRFPVLCIVVALCVPAAAGLERSRTGSPAGAAVPATTSITPALACGQRSLREIGLPTQAAPVAPVHVLATDVRVSSLVAWGGGLVAIDEGAGVVSHYAASGQVLGSFRVGFRVTVPSVAVDPLGNVYVAAYPNGLVKFSRTGHLEWSRPHVIGTQISGQIDGVFALRSAMGWRVGVVPRGGGRSVLLDPTGGSAGFANVTGSLFSPTPDGGLLATDGRYVRRYDSAGNQRAVFGDGHQQNDSQPTGGALHFYLQGGAVLAPDGRYWVADSGRGLEAVTHQGFWDGVAPDQTLGLLTQQSPLAILGDTLYFAAGGPFGAHQNLSSISLSDVAVVAAAPRPASQILGFGAGLVTNRIGQYFPAGVTPSLHATFDPWWSSVAPGLRLVTRVRSRSLANANIWPSSTSVMMPMSPTALADIPIRLPAAVPGPYEVDVRLVDQSGAVVGATCLRYSVGAPGARLDLASLPGRADYGGPSAARGVALADELGTNGMRAVIPWARLLPDINGPFNWSATDASFSAAASEAARRGVTWWVLVGSSDPIARALVANGTWERRIVELAAHYRGVVTLWEAWNEPNNNFGSASSYVSQVLAPFARAVRRSDPRNRVIGGSTLGVDLNYWRGIVSAGGLALLDVAGIHPYTGHNRSWEEEGTQRAIALLQSVLAESGHSYIPLWDTESAWWSDGPANIYTQGDSAARAMIWTKILGLGPWNYFTIEGGYGDYGLSYSLIQSASQPDDFVKPAALAAMTAAAQLEGRSYRGQDHIGRPHVYAAAFGPRAGSAPDVMTAVWSDDLPTTVLVSNVGTTPAAVVVTNEYGASQSVAISPGAPYPLRVGPAPHYVRAGTAANLVIGPIEEFGTDVALASQGAVAQASSALATNRPGAAIDGISDANSAGDLPGVPAWASACGDPSPTLTVDLAGPKVLDRIITTSHSIASIVPGMRDYSVAIKLRDGSWRAVDRVVGQFTARRRQSSFAPVVAVALRVTATAVNYGGMANGTKPYFWSTAGSQALQQPWCGPTVIEEIEAYEHVAGG